MLSTNICTRLPPASPCGFVVDNAPYWTAVSIRMFGKFFLSKSLTLTLKVFVCVKATSVPGDMASTSLSVCSTRPPVCEISCEKIDWMSVKISFAVATTTPAVEIHRVPPADFVAGVRLADRFGSLRNP